MKAFKGKLQKAHFCRRMKERFGVSVSSNVYQQFVKIIQKQQATFVERQSLRVTVWDINYENETIRVVYDSKRQKVVTALYPRDKPKPKQKPSEQPKPLVSQLLPTDYLDNTRFGLVRSAKEEEEIKERRNESLHCVR